MKKYLSLVKMLFIQQYRVKPQQGKSKKGGTIAAFVVLGLCLLPMLIGIASGMLVLGQLSRDLDNVANIISMLVFLCQGVVLLFGIPGLMTNVFSSKDADKLLYLPMRSATIFAAKLTVVYLNEVITTAVMLLVTLLPFGVGLNASASYFLLFVFALVLIPLLPMLVGSIVAIPLSVLITKVGKNGVVKTLLNILLFAIILVGYVFVMYELGFMSGMGDFDDVENATEAARKLLEKLQGMGLYAKYVNSNFTLASAMVGVTFGAVAINLLISLAENVLLFGIVLAMAIPFYHWMLTSSIEGDGGTRKVKSGKTDLQVSNHGVIRELIFTDIKRVTRDSQMGFQCILSLIIAPIMIVLFYVIFSLESGEDGNFIQMVSGEPLYQVVAPIVIVAYMSMIGMASNALGIYPISRENKSFYIIKSLPIAFNKYLLAKVILATSAMLISDTLTCVLTVILFGVQWYYGLLILVTMALLGFGAMCITTLIDLKDPKLGWTNFNQSLKNAKNSWLAGLVSICVFIVMLVIAIPCIVGYSLIANGWYMLLIMWLLIVGLAVGFAIVSYKIMTNNAQKHFDAIEP